jgi:hypothetical protein
LVLPKNETDFNLDQLIICAKCLGLQTHVGTKKRLKLDIWNDVDTFMKRDIVVLATHVQTNPLNIVNASEDKIMLNLRLRYVDPDDLESELGPNPSVDTKRELLKQALLLEEHHDYIDKFDGTGIEDVHIMIPDILHMWIRIFNKLLFLLIQTMIGRPGLRKVDKQARLNEVNEVLADVFMTVVGAETNIKITVDWNKSQADITTISGNKLDKLDINVIDRILNVLYKDQSERDAVLTTFDGKVSSVKHENWITLFAKFFSIMSILRIHGSCEPQFRTLCDDMDSFSNLYIDMFHYEHIGNYMHSIIMGHVTNLLRRNKYCISNMQQQACENANNNVSSHWRNQCNHGGGPNGVHPAVETMNCFLRNWLRIIEQHYTGFVERLKSLITKDDLRNCSLC